MKRRKLVEQCRRREKTDVRFQKGYNFKEAALLWSFRGQAARRKNDLWEGSTRGNWDPRESQ